jgi:ribosomal protein S18 acetylase RimI-like enzyme
MKVEQTDTHIQLHQLFILPEYQRRGIGSGLLEDLLTEAGQSGLPVRLRVLRVNPAKGLYERYGFRVTSEEPERFYMQRTP